VGQKWVDLMCDKPCRIEKVYGNSDAGVFRQAYAYQKASSLVLANWCERHLIDRVHGSWHHQLNDTLQPVSNPWFGKPDFYHSLQACLTPLQPQNGGLAHGLAAVGIVLDPSTRS
jgi:hypothetical protein